MQFSKWWRKRGSRFLFFQVVFLGQPYWAVGSKLCWYWTLRSCKLNGALISHLLLSNLYLQGCLLPVVCCGLRHAFQAPFTTTLLLTKFPPSLLKTPFFSKQCFSSQKNHSLQTSLVNIRNIVLPINRLHFNFLNIFYWTLPQNFF